MSSPDNHDDKPARVLTLNDKQHLDSTLYRLQNGWRLEFRLGSSLLGKKVYLFTNYPRSENVQFERREYYELEWLSSDNVHKQDDTSVYAQINLNRSPGSYHYYFVFNNREDSDVRGSGYFNVDPVLKFGKNLDQVLSLDSIQCQTVLAKSLGQFDMWEDRLRCCKESGYNVVHFTPIQELGDSNSSYSLKHQLKFNPVFNWPDRDVTSDDIKGLIDKMRREWGVLSICDIVLNHTANESCWLVEHPECTYNMSTAPHLRPAALLDFCLHQLTVDVAGGKYVSRGLTQVVNNEQRLDVIRYLLESELIPELRLHEFYTCNVDDIVRQFQISAQKCSSPRLGNSDDIILVQDEMYRRNRTSVNLDLALGVYNIDRDECKSEESRVETSCRLFREKLEQLNSAMKQKIEDHLVNAINNCLANIRYFRLQEDGPKIQLVTLDDPLVPRYFTGKFLSLKEAELEIYSDTDGQFVMAHNGWVMNSDPLKNFATSDSNVYLRRELIAWGDSVKLRYGSEPADCPFLWDHMRRYVEQTAEIFDGVRLDNCHSTPLPVAEYLLDCARRVCPDLYVVAELFTNSDQTDNIFVNKLGITSLIREAMSAWNSHELGRLVYRYGGEPAGSFYHPLARPLVPSIAHALFLDVSHDNPSPIEKRSVYDLIPSSALVSMACCGTGSSRGYDELVPHHIHVVSETRLYNSWTENEDLKPGQVNIKSGIIEAKRSLNELHRTLSELKFDQVFVDQMSSDVVAVTRHNPYNHETVVLVAHTSFAHPNTSIQHYDLKHLSVEGVLDNVLLEITFSHVNNRENGLPVNFKQDTLYINGLTEYQTTVRKNLKLSESRLLKKIIQNNDKCVELELVGFKPGSVVAIKVSQHETIKEHLDNLNNIVKSLRKSNNEQLLTIVSELKLNDLNYALYRCSQEDSEQGLGSYDVPNFGPLVYCGLQGFVSLLSEIRPNNDLGHPLCDNLRRGDWMLDYISGRLKFEPGTKNLGIWFENCFNSLRLIPRYLIPSYFDFIVTSVYQLLITRSVFLMSSFVRNGSTLVRSLALGSVQCAGVVESAPLPLFSPALETDCPEVRKITLSAGLPHFTTGYMRSWGRDTFISLRGLFLLTGRYSEARFHILGYAACLRHGLIPNLLDRGVNARFNCRDAVWWWLHSIISYIDIVDNGEDILNDPVSRIFPKDDSPPCGPGLVDQTLSEVMQEALQTHFQGLSFRERNAGDQIDAHMTHLGFNNTIGVKLDTGFVFGGNEHNCGTWMDKMGSSEHARNKGTPATPRDGSAVEIVGLSKSVLSALAQLSGEGFYPHQGVERTNRDGTTTFWTFKQWEQKIASNFEKMFWISVEPDSREPRPDLIHRRGVYKDSYGATQPWADYQLRCNFPIAMVVAPEMFDPIKAWTAIKTAEKLLLGPLGMKTLDPDDWAYNGFYDNDNDSNDSRVAHGFNYHQGPEWVWPVGFFLRARLYFAKILGDKEELNRVISHTMSYLSQHYKELVTSHWRGLPELTNKDGAYCAGSCRTQAWSMACILEVMYDLQQIRSVLSKEEKENN